MLQLVQAGGARPRALAFFVGHAKVPVGMSGARNFSAHCTLSYLACGDAASKRTESLKSYGLQLVKRAELAPHEFRPLHRRVPSGTKLKKLPHLPRLACSKAAWNPPQTDEVRPPGWAAAFNSGKTPGGEIRSPAYPPEESIWPVPASSSSLVPLLSMRCPIVPRISI